MKRCLVVLAALISFICPTTPSVTLQRRREILGLDAMRFLPAQIQADTITMFDEFR